MEIKRVIIETGHTIEELKKSGLQDENSRDFPLEELFNGAIEPQEEIIYWYIDGRVYEVSKYLLEYLRLNK